MQEQTQAAAAARRGDGRSFLLLASPEMAIAFSRSFFSFFALSYDFYLIETQINEPQAGSWLHFEAAGRRERRQKFSHRMPQPKQQRQQKEQRDQCRPAAAVFDKDESGGGSGSSGSSGTR